jgi:hypothetical protein
MTRCKRAKRTSSRINQANSCWNSCCSRICVLMGWALGERSAATRPIAMRRRAGERMEERRISTSSASWQGLQRTHSWRGSGAPIGSLSAMGRNQIKPVQIEQRTGLYQRPLCPVFRLAETVTPFPGSIISFVRCPFRVHCRVSAGGRSLLCSRYASLSSIIIVPYTL